MLNLQLSGGIQGDSDLLEGKFLEHHVWNDETARQSQNISKAKAVVAHATAETVMLVGFYWTGKMVRANWKAMATLN